MAEGKKLNNNERTASGGGITAGKSGKSKKSGIYLHGSNVADFNSLESLHGADKGLNSRMLTVDSSSSRCRLGRGRTARLT